MVLHCNGDMAEMAEAVAGAPALAGPAAARAAAALALRRGGAAVEEAALVAEFAELSGLARA